MTLHTYPVCEAPPLKGWEESAVTILKNVSRAFSLFPTVKKAQRTPRKRLTRQRERVVGDFPQRGVFEYGVEEPHRAPQIPLALYKRKCLRNQGIEGVVARGTKKKGGEKRMGVVCLIKKESFHADFEAATGSPSLWERAEKRDTILQHFRKPSWELEMSF